MNWKAYSQYYLVGIKGVAMTSLAQILLDAGKTVAGSDVAEDFVTKDLLTKLQLKVGTFDQELPAEIDCVIYTAAHQGQFNPQVLASKARGIACFSQAEALAAFCNEKKGVAVCGVGGKSTTSAMISWILEKTGHTPSFSVGVGAILGMERTGKWSAESEYFVAEADEYVTDPTAPSRGEPITPRFSYMFPFLTVCTNFAFDHPDVYGTIADTKAAYQKFFDQINPAGFLLLNDRDRGVVPTSTTTQNIFYFGSSVAADFGIDLASVQYQAGKATALLFDRTTSVDTPLTPGAPQTSGSEQTYQLTLQIPGIYNLENAGFAVFACKLLGVPAAESCAALATFQSTKRRFERIGEKNGVLYFDDYAHHPSEVKNVIAAIQSWYPGKRIVIAFQSHTFSRTKQLFEQFVDAFATTREVLLLDIFASAREAYDPSITSDMLAQAVAEKYPHVAIQNLHTIESLATYLQELLQPGDICLTIGAGDIYRVHDRIK
jgi:UDP-N-acetylmuramate--alanine ligase